LPAILHKIMDQKQIEKKQGAAQTNPERQARPTSGQPAPNASSQALPVRQSSANDRY
jgi:hypothetical protein